MRRGRIHLIPTAAAVMAAVPRADPCLNKAKELSESSTRLFLGLDIMPTDRDRDGYFANGTGKQRELQMCEGEPRPFAPFGFSVPRHMLTSARSWRTVSKSK